MMYRSASAFAVVLVLAFATIPTTNAATPAPTTLDLGPLNFLRPMIVNVLGESTVQQLQNNIGSISQAVGSGDTSKILNATLAIVDPANIIRNTLNLVRNYETQMWNPEFRTQIGGIFTGASKAFSSGINCFSKNLQDNLANFTSAYVTAMDKAFAANAPNTSTPAQGGIAGAPATIISSARLFIDMLTAQELRSAVIEGVRGLMNSYNVASECARGNTTELTRSWESLTALLSKGATAGTTGTAGAKATVAATPKPSSFFFGLF